MYWQLEKCCSALLWCQSVKTYITPTLQNQQYIYFSKWHLCCANKNVKNSKSFYSRLVTCELWPSGKQHHWCIIYQRLFVLGFKKHHCDVWTDKTTSAAGLFLRTFDSGYMALQRDYTLKSLQCQKKGCSIDNIRLYYYINVIWKVVLRRSRNPLATIWWQFSIYLQVVHKDHFWPKAFTFSDTHLEQFGLVVIVLLKDTSQVDIMSQKLSHHMTNGQHASSPELYQAALAISLCNNTPMLLLS